MFTRDLSCGAQYILSHILTPNFCRSEQDDSVAELDEDHDESDAYLLFKESFKDTWDLQLWVMPQSRTVKKLFKFDAQHMTGSGHLCDFLGKEKLEAGDRRLYMEAHVVRKIEE